MHRCLTLLLIALLTLSGCATLGPGGEPPSVSLADLRPAEMTLFEQRYAIKLRILNPNDRTLDIRGMSYTLYLNDQLFARGVSDQTTTIAGFGEGVIEGMLVSHLDKMLGQLLDGDRHRERAPGEPALRYRLVGKIALKDRIGRLPFEYTGEWRLPTGSRRVPR